MTEARVGKEDRDLTQEHQQQEPLFLEFSVTPPARWPMISHTSAPMMVLAKSSTAVLTILLNENRSPVTTSCGALDLVNQVQTTLEICAGLISNDDPFIPMICKSCGNVFQSSNIFIFFSYDQNHDYYYKASNCASQWSEVIRLNRLTNNEY